MSYIPRQDIEVGTVVTGKAVTAKLFVSPDGDGTDGSTWDKAYTTIQAALTAASTDANESTLIMVAPHATAYDINTTGDPTFSGNYEIVGTHRVWAAIKNSHASATSILKFTGKCSIADMAFTQTGAVDGVIFTASGYRMRRCSFDSTACTGAVTAIHIDGSSGAVSGGMIEDVQIDGNVTYTTGLYMDTAAGNYMDHAHIETCLTGIQTVNVASDGNHFDDIDIGHCTLGLDLDAGNGQHFSHINFYGNTTNIDDEVSDHHWSNIHGSFPISVLPDNFTGVAVDTGDGADTWSALATVYTESAGKPFRVVGTHMSTGTAEYYRLQLTGDDGTTYFDDIQTDANRREGVAAPGGTEFIFNAGTVIKARSKSVSAGVDELDIWLEIQAI
ncbi:MAG: hypothetical protein GY696_25135 [Gammaproteobacteria bacterium]|nr:hypothetical protein [Gammaproteobacteria bacterium]